METVQSNIVGFCWAITMSWICYWYAQEQSSFYPCMRADVECVAVQLQDSVSAYHSSRSEEGVTVHRS